jgi:hypothetical protein
MSRRISTENNNHGEERNGNKHINEVDERASGGCAT